MPDASELFEPIPDLGLDSFDSEVYERLELDLQASPDAPAAEAAAASFVGFGLDASTADDRGVPAVRTLTIRSDAAVREERGLALRPVMLPAPMLLSPRSDGTERRLRLLVVALMLLAVAEAVPAVLWTQAYLSERRAARTHAERPTSSEPAAEPPRASGSPSVAEFENEPASALSALLPGTQTSLEARLGLPLMAPTVPRMTSPVAEPRISVAEADQVVAATPSLDAAVAVGDSGDLVIESPFPVQVMWRGRMVGSSAAGAIRLPIAEYGLDLVNDELGFRERRGVTIRADRAVTLRVEALRGKLSLAADPAAEVWLDGERLGETPIDNLDVPIGARVLVFRHPEFGERTRQVSVTLKQPTFVIVDFRRP